MSKEIYRPPESKLIDDNRIRLSQDKFNGFDKPMKLAALALLIMEIIFMAMAFIEKEQSLPDYLILGFLSSVLLNCFYIYLIRVLRGNIVCSKKKGVDDRYLSIWGYIWRSTVIRVFSWVMIMLAIIIFLQANHLDKTFLDPTSPRYVAAITLFLLPVSIVSTWLIFSSNRKSQLGWITKLIRGY